MSISIQDKVTVYIQFMEDHNKIPSFWLAREEVNNKYSQLVFESNESFYQYLEKEQNEKEISL